MIGVRLSIMVSVGLDKHAPKIMRQFEAAIKKLPEVIQCFLIAGQSADYMLKVMVPDMHHYQVFLLEKLTLLEGVSSVRSSFVLQSIIDKTAYPLDYIWAALFCATVSDQFYEYTGSYHEKML